MKDQTITTITIITMINILTITTMIALKRMQVQFKGRLRPGRMLLVDFSEGKLIEDNELLAYKKGNGTCM